MTEFEDLYNTYFQDVFRYLRRLSGDEHIAEEMTSECFFKALGAIDRFRGECDIRVWLFQIAKNCYFTYLKKRRRLARVTDEEALLAIADTSETAEERMVRQEDAWRIRTCLRGIPEPYQEVFLWRVLGELSFKQIGQLFGKTDNWACVTYHRARMMIKRKLEEHDHEA